MPPPPGPVSPLDLDPMPERDDLVRQVNEIMDPIFGEDVTELMTQQPLREREGLDQILVTSERCLHFKHSCKVYNDIDSRSTVVKFIVYCYLQPLPRCNQLTGRDREHVDNI
jgi:hypothetical protein